MYLNVKALGENICFIFVEVEAWDKERRSVMECDCGVITIAAARVWRAILVMAVSPVSPPLPFGIALGTQPSLSNENFLQGIDNFQLRWIWSRHSTKQKYKLPLKSQRKQTHLKKSSQICSFCCHSDMALIVQCTEWAQQRPMAIESWR